MLRTMSHTPIHVIGGGLAGSEAAWQAAEAGATVVLHEMRPVAEDRRAPDRRARRAGLLQHLPLGRPRAQRGRPAARGDAALRLADHAAARSAQAAGRRRAGGRPRCASRPTVTAALDGHPQITIERGEIAGLPPAEWDNVIIATGPLTSPALAEAIQRADRRGRARLLRRHRADRPLRVDRLRHRLGAVALRQGRAGRHRRRLPQLPDGRGAVRGLRRRAADGPTSTSSRSGRTRPTSTAACRSR